MKILFLHGWQSTPGGIKPTCLKDHGHEVLNPALPDEDFDAAVRVAQAEFDRHKPDVVVGSSRGGAVAMNVNSDNTPLVLLCPAWKRWGTATAVKPGTVVLHSRTDEVVPFEDSLELVRNSGLPASALVEVGTEHRLADDESLKKMLEVVEKAAHNYERGGHKNKSGCGLSAAAIFVLALVAIDVVGVLIAQLLPVLQARFAAPGVQVTVRNTGKAGLHNVMLRVTGASSRLGNISSGSSAQANVKPVGESHLEIEFSEHDGQRKLLNAGGYFETNYRGTIDVSIKDGIIEKNEHKITP